jgi:UDP:flavonoid glycosyltransferase YjiC (YdhE family)
MRILFATTSGAGHFGPLLPFASGFRKAGHDVQVAAPRSFAESVRRAGYPYRPCADIADEDFARIRDRIAAASPAEGNRLTALIGADLAPRAILPGMLAALDEWRPDVIVREVGELGSFVAAELRDIPQVEVLIGMGKFTGEMAPVVGPLVAAIRESVGLDPDESGMRLSAVPKWSLLPEVLEEPDAPRPADIQRFRAEMSPAISDARDPLIYVTFGSVSASIPFAATTFRTVVETLTDVPARLLVTTGGPAEWAATLPAHVAVERWIPQEQALSRASMMVCHGGMGTVLGGLAAGVPMVIVPQFADHPDNAARVTALGAGLRVGVDGMAGPVDPEAVRTATLRVLSEATFGQAAKRIAAEISSLPLAGEAPLPV